MDPEENHVVNSCCLSYGGATPPQHLHVNPHLVNSGKIQHMHKVRSSVSCVIMLSLHNSGAWFDLVSCVDATRVESSLIGEYVETTTRSEGRTLGGELINLIAGTDFACYSTHTLIPLLR